VETTPLPDIANWQSNNLWRKPLQNVVHVGEHADVYPSNHQGKAGVECRIACEETQSNKHEHCQDLSERQSKQPMQILLEKGSGEVTHYQRKCVSHRS